MKKLDATQKAQVVSDFKNSCSVYRLLFVKAFSLASVIIFLSNISPVSASTQILNNISNNFSGGTNMLKAIPPAYIVGSKLYADSDFAFTGDEEKTLENLSPNIKLQTKAAFDIAFAGGERFKNGVDKFSGVNSSFTSENRQFAEIKAPAVIGEKQNNLSQGTDQHENTNNFSFMGGLPRGLARGGRAREGVLALGAKSPTKILSILNSNNETRILMDVTAGELSADSTEAVNGSQLYSLGTAIATSFGGEASYKDGKWVAPRFHFKGFNENGDITDTSYNDVSSAFIGVGNSFKKVKDQFANIKDEIGKEISRVQSDALLWDSAKGAFVAEHGEQGAKTNSKITSLANGDINSSSSDAVAGNQLHALGSSIAKTFGGQASYEGGKWVAPTFHFKSFNENGDVTDTTYENVTAAFAGVGDSIANIKNEISKEISSEKSDSLNWSAKDNAFVAEHGKEGSKTNSKITSLANGSITKASTDAVTGGQLYSMNNTLASYFGGGAKYENDQWTAPSFTLKMFGEDGKEGESQTYNNVGSAFAGIDTNFSNVNKHLNTVVNDFNEKLDNINKEIKGDSLLWSNEHDAFVATHGEKDHKIKFLAAGDVGQASTDAVNGSQLYALGNGVSKSLGGKASYEDGKWVAPTFHFKGFNENGDITDTSYNDVSSAFTGVGNSFKKVKDQFANIKDEIGKEISTVQSDALLWNGTKGAFVAEHGKEGSKTNSKITSLANGSITKDSTDAVTGGQLYSMNNTLASYFGGGAKYENDQWTAPSFTLKMFGEDGKEGESQTYNNVGSAFAGIDTNFSNVNKHLNTVVNDFNEKLDNINKEIKGDSLLWSNEHDAFVATHGEKDHKIKFLAAGDVGQASTDAVNGSQLYALGNGVSKSLGGKASYEDGKWVAPTFSVKTFSEDGTEGTKEYGSVSDAFDGVNVAFTNFGNKITNQIKQELGNQITEQIKSDALSWNDGEKAYDAGHGAEGARSNSKIMHLADGTVASGSADAVTGGQLYALGSGVSKSLGGDASYKDGKWVAPTFHFKGFNENGDITDTSYNDVSSAFTGVGNSFEKVKDQFANIKDEIGKEISTVQSDALLWDGTKGAFVAEHGKEGSKTNSKITSLANGSITKDSTDAVNGSQLYALGNGVSKSLGGKASYEDGKWVAPTFHFKGFNENGDITDTSYNDVSSAFTGVGNSFEKVKDQFANIKDEIGKEISTVQSDALLWDGTKGAFVAEHGKEGSKTNSKITSLANGSITKASTDAVTGGQLYSMNNTLASYFGGGAKYENDQWTAPSFTLKMFGEDGKEGESQSYNNVGSAFAGIDTNFSNVNKHLNTVVNDFNEKLDNINKEIKGDSLLWSNEHDAFVATHGEKDHKIKFLAAGDVGQASTDAVNGSQLYALGNGVSKSLGGKASYEDGKWVAPTFSVKTFSEDGTEGTKEYGSVSDAFDGVNVAFTNFGNKITNQIKQELGNQVAEQIKSDALSWNDGEKAYDAGHGAEGARSNSKIMHLADGTVASGSADAVTGGQLYALGSGVSKALGGDASYKDGKWVAPTFHFKGFNENGDITDTSYNDVSSAFTGVGNSFKKVKDQFANIKDEIGKEISTVQSDALLWSGTKGAFVAEHGKEGSKTNSKITSLANGSITKDSTDAVNGSQLYALGNGVSKSLGGKASYEDGKWVAPTFHFKGFNENGDITDTSYNDVSSAFTGVGNSFEKVKDQFANIKDEIGKEISTVQSDALLWNGTKGAFVAEHGKEGSKTNSKITSLANGSITKDSTDAVTGGQLYSMNNTLASYFGGGAKYENDQWTAPSFTLKMFGEDGKEGESQSYNNVGSAFAGIDTNFSNVNKHLNTVVNDFNEKLDNINKEIKGDSLLWSNEHDAFVATHGEKDHKIKFLAAGDVGQASTDAVNGSQLYALGHGVSKALGGDASYEDGKWVAPTFHFKGFNENGDITDTSYNDVSSAFTGVGNSFEKVKDQFANIKDEIGKEISTVQSDALLWSGTKGAFVAEHGEQGAKTNSKITSLANGSITKDSTDAVNGSQLYALGNGVSKSLGGKASYEDGKWVAPTFSVKTFSEDGTEGTKEYGSVSDAFDGVNVAFTSFGNKITNQIKQELGNQITEQIKSDALSWNDGEKAYDAGHGAEGARSNSKIMHLADGTVASGSADAVTGGQLYALGSGVSKTLGGDASYKDGKWVAPTFHFKGFNENGDITDTSYNDVSSAFTGVGNSFEKVKDQFANIKDEIGKEISTVQSDALLWNGTKGAFVAEHGKEGSKTNSKITSLANGSITKDSTDAVTGGQLYSMNNTLASYFGGGAKYENDQWTAPSFTLKMFGEDGKEGESQSYNNVGSAFAGIDTNFSNVNKHLNTVVNDFNEKLDNINKEIKGDSLLWSNEHDAFVATHGKKDSKIKFLAAGDVGQASTDAVNGSQLYALGNDVSKSLGGKASYEDGKWVAPTFHFKGFNENGDITDTSYNDVSSAFTGVGNSFKKVKDQFANIKDEIGKEISTVQSDALLWNGTKGAFVAEHGKEGSKTNSKITSLANGSITKASTDAVTGGQLYSMNNTLASYFGGGAKYENDQWTAPSFTLKMFGEDGKEGESQSYNNVGSAFAGIDTNFSNVNKHLNTVVNDFNEKLDNINKEIKGDSLLWSNEHDAFVATHGKKDSKIKFLAAGDVGQASTDAVNGSQLYALGSGVSKSLGGKASYEDGKWVAPTFSVKTFSEDGTEGTKEYGSVSDAFDGVNVAFTSFGNKITNQIKQELGNQITEQIKSDALSWNDGEKAYDAGHGTEGARSNSKIMHLADGTVASGSADAVTGGQLYALGSGVSKTLGGDASYKDGKWVAPTFHFKGFNENGDITDTSYNDVSSAFTGVGNSFEKVKDQFANIKDEIGKEISTVQSDALLWDGTKGAFVAEHGKEGSKTNSKITSLANGSITKASTDAVTGGQLYSMNNTLASYFGGGAKYENDQWTAPSFTLKMFGEDGKEGESQTYNNVGSAFAGIDTNFSNVNKHLNTVVNDFNEKLDNINKEIKGDSLLWSNEHDAFVATHGKKDSKIKFLAAGDVGQASTDAVNGSQLYALGNGVSKSLGGDASYEDGKWVAPTFHFKSFNENGDVTDTSYNDVSSAFTGVGNSFEKVKDQFANIKDEIGKEISTVQSDALLWNGTKGAFVAEHGEQGAKTNSKITSLANGSITKDSTDAVNGSQLHALGNGVSKSLGGKASYEDGKWVAPIFSVKTFSEDGTEGTKEYGSVSDAFDGVNVAFTSFGNKITNQIKQELGNQITEQIKSDALSWNDGEKAYDAGHGAEGARSNSKIMHLADGTVASGSADAVTGGQLYALGSGVSKTLGGDASYKDGKWVAPTFHFKGFNENGDITDTSYNDVSSAFTGVGNSFEKVKDQFANIKDEIGKEISTVQSDALLWDGTKGAFVAEHGKEGSKTNSKITSLANGSITKASTDAVTGGQLYSMNNTLASYFGGGAKYENDQWTAPSFTLKMFGEDGKEGESQSYNNVGSAFAGIDTNFSNVNKHLNTVVNDFNEKLDNINKEIKGDSLLWSNEHDAFVATHGKKDSKIKFLAAGDVGQASTDAVNGSQLYALGSGVSKSLGGKASYEDGKWVAPTFSVKTFSEDGTEGTKEYGSVSDAFDGVNVAFTSFGNKITNQIKQELGNQVAEQIKSDALSWNDGEKAYDAGHGAEGARSNSKIMHLADGTVASGSADAVTGGQLYALGSGVSKALGGDASYKDGKWVAPTFHFKGFNENGDITDTSYNDVSSAFTGVGNSFEKVKDQFANIKDEIGKEISTVQSDALLWDGTKGAFVAEHGEQGAKTNSKITSLANGSITKDSTDAVNGSQLYALGNGVSKSLGGKASYEDGKWVAPTFSVKTFSEDGTEGTKEYGSVSDAFDGVNVAFTNFGNKITNQIKQELGNQVAEQIKSDALSWNDGEKAYDAGHGAEGARSNSKIMHLADGTVASGSADAVTGGQLYALGSGVSKALGGDASYKDGKWVAPTFHFKGFNENGDITDTSYNDVSSAFTGVGNSFKKVKDQFANIKDEIGKEISTVQSDALLWSGTKGAFVAEHGKEGSKTNSKITSLANGSITKASTDAVTGGQLYSMNNTLASYFGGGAKYENDQWTAPSFTLKMFGEDGKEGESQTYNNVGSAFAGIDTNFSNVNKHLNTVVNDFNEKLDNINKEIKGDSLLWSNEHDAFVATHGKKDSKIKFLAAGDVGQASTDAVNGSQLYALGNGVSKSLGGDASYKDGKWVAPTFHFKGFNENGDITDTSYNDVSSAFTGVGDSFEKVKDQFANIKDEIGKEISTVQSDALLWSGTKGAFVAEHGEQGAKTNSKITSLANGSITKDSTDAVNGSQLYALGSGVSKALGGDASYKDGKWVAPTFHFKGFNENGDITDTSYNDVSSAFTGVGNSFKKVKDQFANIKDEIGKEISTVQSDALLWSGTKGAFVAEHGKEGSKTNSKITSLANGDINSSSSDAVAGNQLHALGNGVSKALGGDASYKDGKWVAPTFHFKGFNENGDITDTSYNDVSSAFTGVGDSFEKVKDQFANIKDEIGKEISTVQSDALLWNDTKGAFVAEHGEQGAKTNSKITSLANGSITKDSTDAVTGGQLYSMNNTLASYFGGGAKYENDQWTAPSFKVNTVSADGGKIEEQSYDNVAKAFASVGTSFTNLHNEVTNAVTDINNHINNVVSDSLVKQDEESKVIKIGAEKGGTSINISNSGDAARTLTGVKSGGLTETSTDAVNGSQLYSMNNTLASYFGGGAEYKEGKWVAPSFKVNVVNANGDKVEEQSYKTVAEAFAGVGSSFTNIHKELKNEINQVVGESLVKQDEKTHVISVGGEKSGTEVTFSNTDGASRTLTGVKAGGLTETSTDAVNGSQLFATNQNVTAVTNDLKTVSENTSKFLGGGADVLKGIAPTYTVQDKSYQSVADAFGGVDRSFTALHEEIAKNTSDLSDTLKQNALLWSDKDHAFVAIHGTDADKKNSKITLLANGSITKDSTDAINGSQLYSMNNTLATYFGGGAEYKEGKWVAPSFKVNTVSADGGKVEEQSYDNVAAAFAGVGSSFTNLHNELKNEISQVVKDSLVKQDEESKVIKIGAEKEGTEITIANSDGAERSLSGVKAGTLSADSTEAVNGGQLYSLNQTLASYFGGGAEFENGQWVAPSFTILSFNEDGSSEETSYNSVSAAFAGVNRSFMKLHHELSDTVEQNALLWSDADESFVALHGKGSEKHNSKLSHLVDGDISAGSTEAITGNQLYQLNQTLAAYLGGGASYQGGEWTAPHFEVKQFKSDGSSSESKSYDNVAGAFEGVNGSLSGINDRLNDVSKNVSTNSLKWNDELEGYDGRHNGSDSKITHVADGDVSEGSKEVVNGGQLWETNQKVSAVENRVESLDQHVKDVESAVTNGAVNYDKDDAGHKTNKVTLVGGDDSAPVLIDNLAEGRIESGSKEAVTGGQLHDYTDKQMKLVLEDAKKYTDEHVTDIVNNGVSESKAYTDMKFETLNYAIEDVRKEARQAAAIGLAVSNLRYYDIPGSLSVSFGSGLWRSQSAFAIGAGYTSEDGNIRSNVSITSAGGHWGIGAGITLRLR
ncbi:Vomp family autotransporter [Bartonella krasnovii]|uniref:Vomp family autotransporter n=1 Tax=Bartonella krasnovii TaxID=2267275 RepID=UPI001F4D080A|nr:Vomp family autotransporter [Bartonella krasnovii]UNF55515.1 Vomp family autotransporter [Bartonella krasnovii]